MHMRPVKSKHILVFMFGLFSVSVNIRELKVYCSSVLPPATHLTLMVELSIKWTLYKQNCVESWGLRCGDETEEFGVKLQFLGLFSHLSACLGFVP